MSEKLFILLYPSCRILEWTHSKLNALSNAGLMINAKLCGGIHDCRKSRPIYMSPE